MRKRVPFNTKAFLARMDHNIMFATSCPPPGSVVARPCLRATSYSNLLACRNSRISSKGPLAGTPQYAHVARLRGEYSHEWKQTIVIHANTHWRARIPHCLRYMKWSLPRHRAINNHNARWISLEDASISEPLAPSSPRFAHRIQTKTQKHTPNA